MIEPRLVEIIIPGRIEPLERGQRFEDPLREYLVSSGLGSAGGAGSKLDIPDTENRQFVAECSILIELFNLSDSLEQLRQQLRTLAVPRGSRLDYLVSGKMQSTPVW
jgi:hypothetical protein